MRKLFLLLLVLMCYRSASAQDAASMDIGFWGGVNSYQGDMTGVDRSKSIGATAGALLRYNFNPRSAVRFSLLYGNIKGIGEFDGAPWEFSKGIGDLSAMYEFNYLPYLTGSRKYTHTTYLLLGLGVSLYDYDYDKDALEEAGAYSYDKFEKRTAGGVVGLNIPLGIGWKFSVGKRMSIGAEFVARKYFDDKIDDLDDPRAYQYEDNNGFVEIRGYTDKMHNNDWTLHLGITISYQVYRENSRCVLYY